MAQNLYDEQDFFAQYGKLPRSITGLDAAPEWPTMRRMIGDVNGNSVLDLGSGYGWFCRWAREAGAESVHGIDISKKMHAQAETFSSDPGIVYECRDLEHVTLPANTYDLVYSSLAIHYLPDLGRLFDQIACSLKPGGRLVFSVEHPIMSAPSDPNWKVDNDGNVFWPLNRYLLEGLRLTNWLGADQVRKYHHTLQTYLSLLIEKGFNLKAYKDTWDEYSENPPTGREGEGHRPFFLMISAQLSSNFS